MVELAGLWPRHRHRGQRRAAKRRVAKTMTGTAIAYLAWFLMRMGVDSLPISLQIIDVLLIIKSMTTAGNCTTVRLLKPSHP